MWMTSLQRVARRGAPLFAFAVAVACLAAPAVALSDGPPRRAGPPHMEGARAPHGGPRGKLGLRGLGKVLTHQKALGLSAEQASKLKSLGTEHARAAIRARADLQLALVDVRSLAREDKVDWPSVEKALRKAEAARTVMMMTRLKATRAVDGVLTPEQHDKLRELKTRRFGPPPRKQGAGESSAAPEGPLAEADEDADEIW